MYTPRKHRSRPGAFMGFDSPREQIADLAFVSRDALTSMVPTLGLVAFQQPNLTVGHFPVAMYRRRHLSGYRRQTLQICHTPASIAPVKVSHCEMCLKTGAIGRYRRPTMHTLSRFNNRISQWDTFEWRCIDVAILPDIEDKHSKSVTLPPP